MDNLMGKFIQIVKFFKCKLVALFGVSAPVAHYDRVQVKIDDHCSMWWTYLSSDE